MRRRRFVGALGGLGSVGIGGCLRLDSAEETATTGQTAATTEGNGAQTATRTTSGDETEAAKSTETEGGEAVPDSYPIGLDEDGVYAYLVDNHVNTLSDASFRERWIEVNKTRGRTMHSMNARVDDGKALVERGVGVDLSAYYDASRGLWRQDLGTGATYGDDRRRFEFPWLAKATGLRTLLLAGDWEPPSATEGGFDVSASGIEDAQRLRGEYEAAEIERFEASGFVTANGIVIELTVEFEFFHEREERLFEAQVRHRVEEYGEVTVTEPSWYDTAVERAPEVSVRRSDDEQFVIFEHQEGNPIEPDTNVVIYDHDAARNWGYRENQEPFEAGETVYLWMENDELRWNRGSRPTAASPQSLDRRLAFWMHRHGAEYFGNVELR